MEIKPITVTPATSSVRDVLVGTLESRDYYGSIEVACAGAGAASCKDGCVNGCKDSSKSGVDCYQSCKSGCAESCQAACKGGNK